MLRDYRVHRNEIALARRGGPGRDGRRDADQTSHRHNEDETHLDVRSTPTVSLSEPRSWFTRAMQVFARLKGEVISATMPTGQAGVWCRASG